MKTLLWRWILLIGSLSCVLNACKSTRSAISAANPESDAFVKTKGTHFELKGKPFYFQGTNFYRVAQTDKAFSDAEIDDIFRQYASTGITVVRFWTFSCDTPKEWESEGVLRGGVVPSPLLDRNGNINEKALIQLDKVIAAAGRHGVKLIFPLVNFEHEYCGMEWWNHVYGEKSEGKEGFYCNPKVITAFKNYATHLLNRRNTVNGVAYKSDPAIMAIELANEPHTTDNYEKRPTVAASCKGIADGKPGTLVNYWIRQFGGYLRTVDRNHLFSTGEEGYKTSGDTSRHGWISDGSKGVDFEGNLKLSEIDFATVHLYPDNSDIPQSDFWSWYLPNVVKDRATVAHRHGKPIVMEETGFSEITDSTDPFMQKYKKNGYGYDRKKFLADMYKAANESDYAGTMIWQVVPVNPANGSPYDDDLFTFSFRDPEMDVIKNQVEYMRAKNW